jgi:hypothetical protein
MHGAALVRIMTFKQFIEPTVYNASKKDRHSRFTKVTRSHAKLRGGLVGVLLFPVVLYLASNFSHFS